MWGWADPLLAVQQHVLGWCCWEPPWDTAIPPETGWDSPSLAVFGSGLSGVTVGAWCLDEKAFMGLLCLPRAPQGQPQP